MEISAIDGNLKTGDPVVVAYFKVEARRGGVYSAIRYQ